MYFPIDVRSHYPFAHVFRLTQDPSCRYLRLIELGLWSRLSRYVHETGRTEFCLEFIPVCLPVNCVQAETHTFHW